MFRASLCPSSGEQDRVLLHMMFCTVTGGNFPPQHVSGIIMPIIRRSRQCITAYGVLHSNRMDFSPQHVSGIIMPITRRTRPCITAYGVLHCNRMDFSPLNMFRASLLPIIRRSRLCITAYGVLHSNRRDFPPPVTVQNTICSNTGSCSPDDGHNDARNMLR